MKKEITHLQVIWRLMKLVKPLILIMCFAIVMGVLGFLCAIGIPVFSALSLLQILGMKSHLHLSIILIILLIMALLRGVFHYLEQAANHYIAFKILAIIRDHVFLALRRLCPAKLDSKDKGNLISLITSDIELLEVFYAHTISPIMIAIFTSAIILAIFHHLHFLTMIIALCAYLIMAIIIPQYVDKTGRQSGQEYRNQIGDYSSYILESFRTIHAILQYHMQKQRKEQMNQKNNEIEKLSKKLKDIESQQIILSQLLTTVSSLVMFLTSYKLYQLHIMTSYQVIMATILMLSSFGPVLALSSLSNNLLSTLSSGKRVIALLDEVKIIKEVNSQEKSHFGNINIKDLSFAYEDEIILQHMSAQFSKNKITGIIGKSGSGKSTLLKLIMRFYDPDQGKITISDKNIKNINTSDLRHMFAYVTQETILFHDSILNNLKIAKLDATLEDVVSACQKASIHDLIMSLPQGYQTPVAELGNSLSGGEKQRLSLARAFLSNAPCILLDEPTSNLDVLNEALILKSLENTKQTIILVSHRQSTMKIAHQQIQMKEGRIS